MTKILNIEGMSCMHCVNAVTKVLERMQGVVSVKVSLVNKTAVVEISEQTITDNALRAAIEEAGYEVRTIQ